MLHPHKYKRIQAVLATFIILAVVLVFAVHEVTTAYIGLPRSAEDGQSRSGADPGQELGEGYGALLLAMVDDKADDDAAGQSEDTADGDENASYAVAAQNEAAPDGIEDLGDEYAWADEGEPESEGDLDNDEDDLDPEERWRRYFSPVGESDPVEIDYFDDALFIGDSRVMGLMLYAGLTEATFYSEKGLNITTALTSPIVMRTGGEKITIPEALLQQQFSKIYIKTGINELGWRNLAMYGQAYGQVVSRIRALQPGAVIYVQSILPVSQKKAQADPVFSIARIEEFNEIIKKMTYEQNVHYLDVFSYIIDDNGFLPDSAGSDGVHLNKEYCQKWLAFLQCHTVLPYTP